MNALAVAHEELNGIGIPYEYMRWTAPVQETYFIGEFSESPTDAEDGQRRGTLILTGTTTGSWMDLEVFRSQIENHFPSIYGLRRQTDDGAVVIFYSHSFPVPTGEANLKRIQINLDTIEWRNME